MTTYSGNKYGQLATFVFSATGGTNANFLTTIATSGTTKTYNDAGGANYGLTNALLEQFVGNEAYLQYKRPTQNTTSELLADGGITFQTEIVTPDPRIVVGFQVGDGITGNHMDLIHYSVANGLTVEAFLGRITYSAESGLGGAYGSTLVPNGTAIIDLVAPGISGGNEESGSKFSDIFTLVSGATISNITNGMALDGSTFTSTQIYNRVPLKEYRDSIIDQVSGSSDVSNLTDGITGITIGNTANLRHVRINPRSKDLTNFIMETSPIISSAITGDVLRETELFVPFGLSGADGTTFGFTLNVISGGTVAATSLFEEFVVRTVNTRVKLDNIVKTTKDSLIDATTHRRIDDISF